VKILPQSLKARLWRFLTKKMHLRWQLRSGLTAKIHSYADWCTYNEIFVNGEYDEALESTLKDLEGRQELVILDIGANMGFFSLKLLDSFLWAQPKNTQLRLFLIEGSKQLCEELPQQLDIDHSRNGNTEVKVLNALAGKRSGSACFHVTKESNQSFAGDTSPQGWQETQHVESIPYIDLIELTQDMPCIDLIKCDIEGSEFDFIEHYPALLEKTQRIVLEIHESFGDTQAAISTLESMGFKTKSILREGTTTPLVFMER
tara:strand:+ start:5952 stop:6731 length:780 start_codon:yes stop_codon:yes gene_type:complete